MDRDGFGFLARQARNGFINRKNCFFAVGFAGAGQRHAARENARRLERSEPPGVLMIRDSGSDELDHAEHDRADDGERDIGGDDA
jgi:hypothetical protein